MMSNMKQIDHPPAVDGPVGSPSTPSTGQASPAPASAPTFVPRTGPLAPGQRWSIARKREVVLRLLRGESGELLSRELGLPIFKLEQWRQKAEAALDSALKEREADTASTELAAAMQRVGELSMENELLRAKMDSHRLRKPDLKREERESRREQGNREGTEDLCRCGK
jgi:transposase